MFVLRFNNEGEEGRGKTGGDLGDDEAGDVKQLVNGQDSPDGEDIGEF